MVEEVRGPRRWRVLDIASAVAISDQAQFYSFFAFAWTMAKRKAEETEGTRIRKCFITWGRLPFPLGPPPGSFRVPSLEVLASP